MTESRRTPISLQFLEYSPSALTSLFSRIEHLPWAMLLQSAAQSHPDNRFDILVADPIATLCNENGINLIRYRDGRTSASETDPFEELHALQTALLPKLDHIAPWPFLGGALGYFSYDLGRQVETLPALAMRDIDIPDLAIGIYDWAIIADHQEKKMVVIQPAGEQRLVWLNKQCAPEQQDFTLEGQWQANMTPQSYTEKFNCVQAYLTSGDCYQINLAQRFEAPYLGSEWEAYQRLAHINGAPFSGFMRMEDSAILSVSPERFLQLHDQAIETKPIKGTRPRSDDPKVDADNIHCLQHAEKDRAENLMIVDLLRNDIGRVASPGSVNVPKLFNIETFPAVHHMVSTVTGTLSEGKHATDLLRACFPGGSITGAPKVRAMEIIEELEPHRRSIYCGSMGYISRCGTMDTSITIRTLVCHKQRIYAWAGGGVVADSEAASEYQETLDKLSKILPTLSK
ncbi:aminodeoxychorismate synthase, component I [Enterovibrio norvegicus FF-33]|uniref:aminodeoxychorismate synthase component I n=1 Tax=Enterovibrio norvegicus TaxID=188144 RepID=UPI0002F41CC4|nr:aminodeoxychorismate synthase component I [Enterovibrio norvegicus]OEE66045.1 aminodeoxychorismate synthase, component I [Enterovibrio norvegicus FF-33]